MGGIGTERMHRVRGARGGAKGNTERERERVVGGGGCSVERESSATTPPRGVRCNHTNPSMDLWS